MRPRSAGSRRWAAALQPQGAMQQHPYFCEHGINAATSSRAPPARTSCDIRREIAPRNESSVRAVLQLLAHSH
jgi:hypothetical protein